MNRRVRTLIVGSGLLFVLIALLFTLPVPYVILSPGTTFNTLGKVPGKDTEVITIAGRQPNQTSGSLILTTVNESVDRVTAFEALVGWLQDDHIVVPHDSVVPPGTSQKQQNQQNTEAFVGSQDTATLAAFCELGYPRGVRVEAFGDGSKAKDVLKVGDGLVSVDGKSITTLDSLSAVLQTLTPGTNATVVVSRGGTNVTVSVPLIPPSAGATGARMGVSVREGCLAPFTVTLALADQIGGPSGGLMFALGIIDKVGPQDLTKGAKIAGTGTMDASGKVGAIGGIQLKMIAAKRAGATVFLAPAANCDDVRGNIPKGLNVVKVDTLHTGVQSLLDLQAGRSVPAC